MTSICIVLYRDSTNKMVPSKKENKERQKFFGYGLGARM